MNEIYNKSKLFEKNIEDFEQQIDKVTYNLQETQNELSTYQKELENHITNQQSKSDNDNTNNNQYSTELGKLNQRLNEAEETIGHYPENTQTTNYAALLEDISNNINSTKELISKNINNNNKNGDYEKISVKKE